MWTRNIGWGDAVVIDSVWNGKLNSRIQLIV